MESPPAGSADGPRREQKPGGPLDTLRWLSTLVGGDGPPTTSESGGGVAVDQAGPEPAPREQVPVPREPVPAHRLVLRGPSGADAGPAPDPRTDPLRGLVRDLIEEGPAGAPGADTAAADDSTDEA